MELPLGGKYILENMMDQINGIIVLCEDGIGKRYY